QELSARGTAMSLHFEDVAEIGRVSEPDRERRLEPAVVLEPQMLVDPLRTQQPLALEMDDPLGERALSQRRERTIGQMAREDYVVVRDRGAQERGLLLGHEQLEARKHADVLHEVAVLARQEIAVRIAEDERRAAAHSVEGKVVGVLLALVSFLRRG